MEQQAQVVRIVNPSTAKVAVKRKSACSGDCHTCHGCPHPDEIVMVNAENPVGARPGDDVIVRSSSGRVLRLAMLLYLMPVVLFFLGYFLSGGGEGQRALVGGLAFVVGIVICILFSHHMKVHQKEMQFSIVQILE